MSMDRSHPNHTPNPHPHLYPHPHPNHHPHPHLYPNPNPHPHPNPSPHPNPNQRDGHVRALASPDVWLTAAPPPRAPAGGTDAASAAAAGAAHACTFCGGRFASRNQLFTHLKQTCAPAVDRTPRARTERYVVAVGYTGDRFHGSHTGAHTPAEEEVRPSLEGWVLAAARRAWGGGEGAVAAGGVEGGEAVAGVWGVLRTEKGAHAAENLFVLSVRAELLQVRARMRIRFRARV